MNTKPISFDEYRKTAQLTAMYPGKGENILYPALGLCGEASELYEKYCQFPEWVLDSNLAKGVTGKEGQDFSYNRGLILKECGDWLWYAVDIATELDVDLHGVWDTPTNIFLMVGECLSDYALELCYHSGKVAEEAKKQLRDDKDLDKDVIVNTICIGLNIIKRISNIYSSSDKGLRIVAHMNNEKLLARRANGTIQGSGDER
jgi:hypothetical protein